MSERAFRDIFRSTVEVPEDLLGDFVRMASSTQRAKELVMRLDGWMFGAKGSLAGSIEAQGRGDKSGWKPLSKAYFDWKEWMMQTGLPIPGEKIPPKEVISTDIWIRTGKFLEFTQTKGKGRLKRIVIKPKALIKGEPFYEVYVRKIDYWEHANAIKGREIAFFTKEDNKALGQIVKEWAEDILAIALGFKTA